ncbi:hypothetical protein NSA24_03645 [Clostridioides mangenotii]|uniref:hypothetical protein n=1 Tax=Metaclostridioides mangenotii TaxID=1540 RepID=UPI001C124082|nr:hypothetical protein [Clostridioides mangenotii]MBU5307806.1 hypothetical protein [Clostridioides mangenotii]MCR1953928.1 hypothetical protein [Clostridioides mangenotii]
MFNNSGFMEARRMIDNREFRNAYNFLKSISDKCAEWYYLSGISAMNIGYYEEGEDYIKRAKFMEPENKEYSSALDNYTQYRNNYNDRADYYNRRRQSDLGGCCCCCGDDCCDTCCKLWCLDSCCECMGGDFISCC